MENGSPATPQRERQIFGLPAVLSTHEAQGIEEVLVALWELTYGQRPESLQADLSRCREFFDPAARGHKLRERLASLAMAPAQLRRRAERIGAPLVVDAGEGRFVVGVEARLIVELLRRTRASSSHLILSADDVIDAEGQALEIYRTWSTRRLYQVIALATGQGEEVMQATAVGIVLALLVNRSTTSSRAIVRLNDDDGGEFINQAIFGPAERFADVIAVSRGRSKSEHKLKSGYPVSEARRRLGERLVISPGPNGSDRLYLQEDSVDYIVSFVAADLARRPRLTIDQLESAYWALVAAFHEQSGRLANRSMVHERPADTAALGKRLLGAFARSREGSLPPKPGARSLPT